MAYEILENNGVDITNLDGAAFNKLSADGRSGVIAGYMNECQMYADGNKVVLSTGCLLIGGIRIKITENEVFTMQSSPTSNTDYELVAEVKRLSSDPTFTVDFIIRPSPTPIIPNDDIINGTGTVRFVVGSFTHTTSGEITNVKRLAKLLTAQDIEVIDNLTSTSTTAALSANQGRLLNNQISIFYSTIAELSAKIWYLEDRVPQLIWSGYLTLNNYEGKYIDEALMFPELFQEPGLFALTFQTYPPTPYDGGPFISTVFIDTERHPQGTASFSGMCFGSVNYGDMSGILLWGDISFENASGYVEFKNGGFYDFGEIEGNYRLTPNILDSIELLSIHRISRTV